MGSNEGTARRAEMAKKRGVHPSQHGADGAAENGHLDVVKWMAALELERRVYPGQRGANLAAENGHLKSAEMVGGARSISRKF